MVFLLLVLGMVAVIFFEWLTLLVLIPVFGYYIYQLRQKNRELEERVAALEGHPTPPKQD